MSGPRPQYPRPADVLGMAAAVELCLSWFGRAGLDVAPEFSAVASLRAVASGAASADAVIEAGRSMGPRVQHHIKLPGYAGAAYGQLHFALALVANASIAAKVDRAVYLGWERTFFGHLSTAATHLLAHAPALSPDVVGPDQRLRAAAAAAAVQPSPAAAKRRTVDGESRLFPRALGIVMEVSRTRARMTVEEVAASVTSTGKRDLSAATLRRIEAGQVEDHPAAPLAVQACGRSWDWAIDRAGRALRLAEKMALLACGEEGDGWYGRVAETFGESTALAIVRVASVSAATKGDA